MGASASRSVLHNLSSLLRVAPQLTISLWLSVCHSGQPLRDSDSAPPRAKVTVKRVSRHQVTSSYANSNRKILSRKIYEEPNIRFANTHKGFNFQII